MKFQFFFNIQYAYNYKRRRRRYLPQNDMADQALCSRGVHVYPATAPYDPSHACSSSFAFAKIVILIIRTTTDGRRRKLGRIHLHKYNTIAPILLACRDKLPMITGDSIRDSLAANSFG